jgi:hypothetical protein
MMPRHSAKRKYQLGFEALERKQLLSADLPASDPQAPDPVTAEVSSPTDPQTVVICGTGTGIRITTT